ncbi:hypothetical protein ABEF79_06100 [Acinetobacter sp. ANC 7454]|uniref:hypothetical protein n=1 Tax=Acinetobacter thermotolerans TaxID=3151487 RepID=UPI00325C1B01
MRIYFEDRKLVGFCRSGLEKFFIQQGWDWQAFLKNGRDAQDFLNTGDAMAIQLVNAVKKSRNME